jgi:hypothetical protein
MQTLSCWISQPRKWNVKDGHMNTVHVQAGRGEKREIEEKKIAIFFDPQQKLFCILSLFYGVKNIGGSPFLKNNDTFES